jgi:hypothetical protein
MNGPVEHSAPRPVEHELMEALQRLVDRRPQDPDLAQKAQRGTLKINISSVAKEAGRSRTLVSHGCCAYPQVRAAILNYRNPPNQATSMAEINRRLRSENAELRRSIKLAREAMAAMVRRVERIKNEADREVLAARRREQGGNRDPNEIAGVRADQITPTILNLVRESE